MRRLLTRMLLLAMMCGTGAAPALPAYRLLAAGAVSAAAAARQAEATTGGRVLDVQTTRAAGRPVYVVKVLLGDGRVKIVHIEGAADYPDNR